MVYNEYVGWIKKNVLVSKWLILVTKTDKWWLVFLCAHIENGEYHDLVRKHRQETWQAGETRPLKKASRSRDTEEAV